jgi:hypothetical protein
VTVEDGNHILNVCNTLQNVKSEKATAFPIWSYHIKGGLASYILLIVVDGLCAT